MAGPGQISSLRKALLDGYERDAKPDGTVEVKFGLSISGFDLCAKREQLTSAIWSRYMWTDDRLSWNPDHYGGLDRIRINSQFVRMFNMIEIWLTYFLFLLFIWQKIGRAHV